MIGAADDVGVAAVDAPRVAHQGVVTGLLRHELVAADPTAVGSREAVDGILLRVLAAQTGLVQLHAAEDIDSMPIPGADPSTDPPLVVPALEEIDIAQSVDEIAVGAVGPERRGRPGPAAGPLDVMRLCVGLDPGAVGPEEIDLEVAGEVLGIREIGPNAGAKRLDESLDRALVVPVIVVGAGMVGAEHELGILAVDAAPIAREHVADRLFVAELFPVDLHARLLRSSAAALRGRSAAAPPHRRPATRPGACCRGAAGGRRRRVRR